MPSRRMLTGQAQSSVWPLNDDGQTLGMIRRAAPGGFQPPTYGYEPIALCIELRGLASEPLASGVCNHSRTLLPSTDTEGVQAAWLCYDELRIGTMPTS